MKVVKKVVAALMVLGALAALTVGVVLKPGRKGDETLCCLVLRGSPPSWV